jgi:hypothetical protein
VNFQETGRFYSRPARRARAGHIATICIAGSCRALLGHPGEMICDVIGVSRYSSAFQRGSAMISVVASHPTHLCASTTRAHSAHRAPVHRYHHSMGDGRSVECVPSQSVLEEREICIMNKTSERIALTEQNENRTSDSTLRATWLTGAHFVIASRSTLFAWCVHGMMDSDAPSNGRAIAQRPPPVTGFEVRGSKLVLLVVEGRETPSAKARIVEVPSIQRAIVSCSSESTSICCLTQQALRGASR